MEKTIRKFYNFDIKSTDEDKREITAVGSKEIIDRDGDLVRISGMDLKNYKVNPVIMWSHQYSELPLGKAIKVSKNGDELRFKIQFADESENPKAAYVYKLLKNGYLNTFSVGFLPDYKSITYPEKGDGKKVPYRIIERSELLELSVCPVPSNPSAILNAYKNFQGAWEEGIVDSEEKKSLDDDLEEYVRILEEGLKPEPKTKPKTNPVDEKATDIKSDTSNEVEEKSNIYEDLLSVFEDGNIDSKHTSKEDEVDYEGMLDILKEEK